MNKIIIQIIDAFAEAMLESMRNKNKDTQDEIKRRTLREGSIDVEYRVIEDKKEKS